MLFLSKKEIFIDEISEQKVFFEVLDVLEEKRKKYGTVNVLIVGAPCAGKTTLANFLAESYLPNYLVTRINQDSYLKNKKDMIRSIEGFYMPDSLFSYYDSELLDDATRLMTYGETMVPDYDKENKKRISKGKNVKKGDIHIFEGLHVIRILENLPNSLKIYLDTSEEICLQRKIKRDYEKYKIYPSRTAIMWEEMSQPMFERFVKNQKEKADIIVKTDKYGKMSLKKKS